MNPHTTSLDPRSLPHDELLSREWLLTSGHGAYAMGSVSGANTRRYHGLLVATLCPPVERYVALACVRDRIETSERDLELASFRFVSETGGVTHPRGVDRLVGFSAGDSAVWEYNLGCGDSASRTLEIDEGRNRATLTWRVACEDPARLCISPMTALRSFHELFNSDERDIHVECEDDAVVLRCDHLTLRIEAPGGAFEEQHEWWDNFELETERARGFDCVERLFSPGRFVFEFPRGGGDARLIATLEPDDAATPAGGVRRDDRWRKACDHLAQTCPALAGDQRAATLARAADAFVVRRRIGGEWSTTILAGYPWFADWGRDAMIALPGLLLTTGRFDDAREVLETFARHERRGLVPNRFDDYGGEPHYNTVDASLWFLHAAREYARACPAADHGVIAHACGAIVDAYRDGTDFDIAMDPADALVRAGSAGTQLTWMDAKTGQTAHTPRHGKAVEINALWVHGLRCAAELIPDRAAELNDLSDRAAASFAERFWNTERGCLYDCLTPEPGGVWRPDASLRLNQIFAASLEHAPLNDAQRRGVVETVRRELLTPMGVRTLAPGQRGYRGRYRGGPEERDSAYHNGTVWPWPVGAYVEASLRAEGFCAASKERARRELTPLVEALSDGCVGQVGEVFDGDGPDQRPGGCPAQAWSVAETLRALVLAHQ